MRTIRIAHAMLATIVIAGAVGTTSTASPAAEAQVRKLNDDFAAAWNAHDAKAVGATWAKDADLITPDGQPFKGREAIEGFFAEGFKTFFAETTFKTTITSIRFLTPNLAMVDCAYEVANVKDPTGATMTERGLYTAIHSRKGGKWSILVARPMVPVQH